MIQKDSLGRLVGVLIWLMASCVPGRMATAQDDRPDQKTRPNILFLFADDQRADAIGAYDNDRIQTPTIDRLARQGFNFRNAYCFGSPHGAVCMPSRAMLHTGRSLYRLTDLNLTGMKTLGQLLGDAGYETFGTGKWHNGKKSFAASFQKGKNIFFGGMCNHAKVPVTQMNPDRTFSKKTTGKHYSSKLFADAAIDFLEHRDGEKPFFCYVAFTAPHDPRMSPGNYNRMYKPGQMKVPENFLPQHPFNNGQLTTRDEQLAPWPRTESVIRCQLASYYGMISHLDNQIARVLDALEKSGEADNTIIVYAADHGLALGSHGLLGKQSLYEHSMKAPMILVGPGIEPGSSDALVYLHDLFPTLLKMAHAEVPQATDGVPLQSVMRGKEGRSFLFLTYGQKKTAMRAVRDHRWKLIRYPAIDMTQLFDLKNDPYETNNLASGAEHAQEVKRLMKQLKDEQARHGDGQPLTVKHPRPKEIDLTGRPRKPDRYQPPWIVKEYFKDVESPDQ